MHLHNKSVKIGKPLLIFDKLESTNSFASEYISKNNPTEGTVIKAYFQASGKGQIGRSWESEAGANSLCSVILYPGFLPVSRQFDLNICVALALRGAIEDCIREKCTIKWPNDIYVRNDKIAGILIQNSIMGSNLQYTIIGTGININQTQFSAELPNPTSFSILTGEKFEIGKVEEAYFSALEDYYNELRKGNHNLLRTLYHDHLFSKDKFMNFSNNNRLFTGRIKGVDETGRLQILEEENLKSYQFHEIKYIL